MGYIALKKIEELINKKIKGDALIQACDQFYTRIPHDFGCVCVCVCVCLCVCVCVCVLCVAEYTVCVCKAGGVTVGTGSQCVLVGGVRSYPAQPLDTMHPSR